MDSSRRYNIPNNMEDLLEKNYEGGYISSMTYDFLKIYRDVMEMKY